MRAALPLAAIILAAGCLGVDRTFPDETEQVVRLHVNAYTSTDPADRAAGMVEVSGLGEDGEERAFQADLRVALQLQLYDEPEPDYRRVREWNVKVDAPDFASPDVPFYRFVIAEGEFPETGTYQATAVAELSDGRRLDASALFHHTKPA